MSNVVGRSRDLIFEPQMGGQINGVGGGQDHPDHIFQLLLEQEHTGVMVGSGSFRDCEHKDISVGGGQKEGRVDLGGYPGYAGLHVGG